ncbi:MAG: energy-coupling factor transporter transmembrane component T family protein [Thermoplasmatota archaeon]
MSGDAIDRCAAGSSFCEVDARVKTVALLLFAAVSALLTDPAALAAALAYILAVAAVSGAPAGHLARRFVVSLPFSLLAALSAYLYAGPLPALAMLARISTCVLALVLLTSVTPFFDLLKGLQGLRVPRVLVTMLLFTYRYIFVIREEMGRMSLARRARGADRGRHLFDRAGMRTVSYTAGMVLVRAYARGRRLEDALRARGFTGEIRTLPRASPGAANALFLLPVVAFSILLLATDRGLVQWL